MALKESQRMYPVAALIQRGLTTDQFIGPYFVRKGVTQPSFDPASNSVKLDCSDHTPFCYSCWRSLLQRPF